MLNIYCIRAGVQSSTLNFQPAKIDDIEQLAAWSWTWPIDVSGLPAPTLASTEGDPRED